MLPKFLNSITADVNLSDDEYVMNEKGRFVPLSISPFRDLQATKHGRQSHVEEEDERPPEWLELAGDLAWTATFSSLTSNTSVTAPIAVWNYVVFFGLTWHLWATQTTYDIKYYTNDWWHRALFASQLGIYALLAAFSGSFTVGWMVNAETMQSYVGDATELTADTIVYTEKSAIIQSLMGVNMTLFISRMLLFAQYLRVLWYRRKSKQLWTWRFYLPAATIFTAACIFLSCFILMRYKSFSKSAAVAQLALWVVAIVIQIFGAAFTPEDGENVLKSKSSLAPRLSTLTVIIMGEGLNGICATLQHTVKSLGLTHSTVAQAIAILMVLYFMWLLYFDGFRTRSPTRKSVSEMWLWFHFPLHLSLIMVLEGVKNLFIFVSLREAVTNLGEAFGEVMDFHIDTNGSWPEHPWLENLLLPLKMSWQQELKDLEFAEGQDPDEVTVIVQAYRWFTTALHNVYLACNEQPDPDAEYSFNYFVSRNDTVVFDDLMGDRGISTTWRYFYNVLMEYTGHWLIAVSGTLLICMAILNLMRRQPRNRFAWGYSLNRIVIGSALIGIGGATSNWFMKDHWWYWIVPTIAISYSAASILDWLILYRSITSIFTKEAHGPDYARVKMAAWDTTSRVDLERLSQFSYRGAASGRKRFTPTFYDARYLASGAGSYTAGGLYALDEVFDPYAEAGAPNYPPFYLYKPGSGGSSNDPTTQSLLETDHESGALM